MTLHLNIHPSYTVEKPRKWIEVKASFRDSKSGACVLLTLEDAVGEEAVIVLHYGDAEYAQEFVDKLKIAALALPDLDVKEEKKNPADFIAQPWGTWKNNA